MPDLPSSRSAIRKPTHECALSRLNPHYLDPQPLCSSQTRCSEPSTSQSPALQCDKPQIIPKTTNQLQPVIHLHRQQLVYILALAITSTTLKLLISPLHTERVVVHISHPTSNIPLPPSTRSTTKLAMEQRGRIPSCSNLPSSAASSPAEKGMQLVSTYPRHPYTRDSAISLTRHFPCPCAITAADRTATGE
jgi:hypothetical protein